MPPPPSGEDIPQVGADLSFVEPGAKSFTSSVRGDELLGRESDDSRVGGAVEGAVDLGGARGDFSHSEHGLEAVQLGVDVGLVVLEHGGARGQVADDELLGVEAPGEGLVDLGDELLHAGRGLVGEGVRDVGSDVGAKGREEPLELSPGDARLVEGLALGSAALRGSSGGRRRSTRGGHVGEGGGASKNRGTQK